MSIPESLKTAPRLVIEAHLRPVAGQRFQPTGFPDLGAATFQTKQGECLLVESAQSMANRLELTVWDEAKNDFIPEAQGLSFVRVNRKGEYLTSSVTEAHRINSVYIEKADGGKFHEELKTELAYSETDPVDRQKFVQTMFKKDVNSLLHGVFLESIGGRLRIPRAISAFIEAEGVKVASSGGVKNDHADPTGKAYGFEAKDGAGNVPFQRTEFTAEKIAAHFTLDLQQIRAYGLDDAAENLLVTLALFKVRALLDGHLRLRTACDFEVEKVAVRRPDGFTLPDLAALKAQLKSAVEKCRGAMTVTPVSFDEAKKAKTK